MKRWKSDFGAGGAGLNLSMLEVVEVDEAELALELDEAELDLEVEDCAQTGLHSSTTLKNDKISRSIRYPLPLFDQLRYNQGDVVGCGVCHLCQ